MKKIIEDIVVEVLGGEMCENEIKEYIRYLRSKKAPHKIESMVLEIDDEYVNMRYRLSPESFERLRRITGYLTMDLKYWNSAKQAEERDRVKHI